jgi:hypothetical protein
MEEQLTTMQQSMLLVLVVVVGLACLQVLVALDTISPWSCPAWVAGLPEEVEVEVEVQPQAPTLTWAWHLLVEEEVATRAARVQIMSLLVGFVSLLVGYASFSLAHLLLLSLAKLESHQILLQ